MWICEWTLVGDSYLVSTQHSEDSEVASVCQRTSVQASCLAAARAALYEAALAYALTHAAVF